MELSNLKTKATALVLTSALCLSSLVVTPNKAEAATDYDTILETEVETAAANVSKDYTFSISSNAPTYVDVTAAQPTDTTLSITAADNTKVTEGIILSTDWKYDSQYNEYYFTLGFQPTATGNYTLSLTFAADTTYLVNIIQEKTALQMNNGNVVITKGFSSKLSVSGASGKVKWTSSKTSVATVNSSGKVTAKKAGTAIITATDENGATAKCTVTVKANTYADTKLTTHEVTYGNAGLSVYKMSYDKKGNLNVWANFLNNSGKTVVQLKNIKITVKNPSKKTIGTYSLKKKNVTINQGGSKDFKFTIKKSKLKIKSTQDLRNSSASTGNGQYLTNR